MPSTFKRPALRLLPALLTAALAACGTGSGTTTPPGTPPVTQLPAAGAYTMSGVVRNSAGQPVAGAKVFAGHTVYYNTNALGVTDANGRYSVSVREPAGSWYAGGQVTREYHGRTYTFELHPDDPAPFNGASGAVRNFEWRLTGPRPDGGTYGGTVMVYADFFDPELLDLLSDVELTLTPDGPLVDGSPGRVITSGLSQTPEGDGVRDVPIGRYRVTARLGQGAAARDLRIRVRNVGEFDSGVTTTFQQNGSGHNVELEVRRAP
ncbi:carboxypeptidase-like regulatory domain-containing protein [Deinococcus sonorensis]|uniref:Carboxypeptidase-like regulatory domain-containing protein n=2 Tax=Deinococcus sonorensis TaxID=309891 RepID=A0AAU7U5F3_9DEIO